MTEESSSLTIRGSPPQGRRRRESLLRQEAKRWEKSSFMIVRCEFSLPHICSAQIMNVLWSWRRPSAERGAKRSVWPREVGKKKRKPLMRICWAVPDSEGHIKSTSWSSFRYTFSFYSEFYHSSSCDSGDVLLTVESSRLQQLRVDSIIKLLIRP